MLTGEKLWCSAACENLWAGFKISHLYQYNICLPVFASQNKMLFFFLLSGLRNGREEWVKFAFIQCPKAFHFSIFVHVCAQSPSYIQIFVTPWTAARQIPLSTEFSRQVYWRGLPFPTPGYLPHPRIELASLVSPTLTGRFFITVSKTI